MPKDRGQVVKTDAAGPDLNIRGQRQDVVATRMSARYAHVSNDAGNATTWNEDAQALGPYSGHFVQKVLVGENVAELPPAVRVLYQRRVRRAGAD